MAALQEIKITDIEEFDAVDVVNVLVAVGDTIEVEQPLVTIESDKAMMDFPSTHAGIVKQVKVTEGGKVKEGDVLVMLEVQAMEAEPAPENNVPKQAASVSSSTKEPAIDQQIEKTTSMQDVRITDIEEFDAVDVVNVLVAVGDEVGFEQPLITIESDKAMMDFPSPYAGVVQKINVTEGSKVKEGDILVSLEVSAAVQKTEPSSKMLQESPPESDETVAQRPVAKQAETNSLASDTSNKSSSAYATPGVYKYARELGVDISAVQGNGRQQRVMTEDVQGYVRNHLHNGAGINAKPRKPLDFSAYGETEAIDQTKIQKVTAKNMTAAWRTIPHVTHFDQADVTLLEQHRKKLAVGLKEKDIKLTPLIFIIKALQATLKKFPNFNVSLDTATEQLVYKKYFDIGIAVDTPNGLLVPVLRGVDKKTITQLAVELIEISTLARERKIIPKQMGGASMTISSLGNLGGQAFTPIINPPEVAILGISKMVVQEKVTEAGVLQQKLLPLALSYDHRVINGADAARFCRYLESYFVVYF